MLMSSSWSKSAARLLIPSLRVSLSYSNFPAGTCLDHLLAVPLSVLGGYPDIIAMFKFEKLVYLQREVDTLA